MGSSEIFRIIMRLHLLPCAVLLLAAPSVTGHGFHGAAMTTKSLDDYLSAIKRMVPDAVEGMQRGQMRAMTAEELKKELAASKGKSAGPARGGKIEARLSAQEIQNRTRVAQECIDALKYLDRGNIYPEEFPDFPVEQIPKYRAMAKKLLSHLGAEGNKALLGAISSTLMMQAIDMPLHNDAGKDMLDLLVPALKSDDVDPDDVATLLTATAGQKPDKGLADFARKVREIVLAHCSRRVLEQAIASTGDPQLKNLLQKAVKTREAEAARESKQIRQKLATASLEDLLQMVGATENDENKSLVIEQIGEHNLTAKEARAHLIEIWQLSQDAAQPTSANLRKRVQAAIARGTTADCLAWLAADDAELNKTVWQQLGLLLDKANAIERRQVRDTAIDALAGATTSKGGKRRSIEVLRRLKDREAAVLIIDAIPEREEIKRIPLELWPQTAALLRELTGQKFGPREGEKALEALGQIKQWRKWRSAQGGAK